MGSLGLGAVSNGGESYFCIAGRIQPVDATLLLLTQYLVCCIDRLNPPAKAEVRGHPPMKPHMLLKSPMGAKMEG
jgi:hypothetical protein